MTYSRLAFKILMQQFCLVNLSTCHLDHSFQNILQEKQPKFLSKFVFKKRDLLEVLIEYAIVFLWDVAIDYAVYI